MMSQRWKAIANAAPAPNWRLGVCAVFRTESNIGGEASLAPCIDDLASARDSGAIPVDVPSVVEVFNRPRRRRAKERAAPDPLPRQKAPGDRALWTIANAPPPQAVHNRAKGCMVRAS